MNGHMGCVFQEDAYEWGSSSILEALPSITSQQRRLALAGLRWRRSLQHRTGTEVHTLSYRVKLLRHTHLYLHIDTQSLILMS